MTHEEINLATKQAFADSLRILLTQKDIRKISIGELSAHCNKNRNTFYYHFTDIYDLLHWTLSQETDSINKTLLKYDNVKDALHYVLVYIDSQRELIKKIYLSLGRNIMRDLYYNSFYSLLLKTVQNGEKNMNIFVGEEFENFLTNFYTEALGGIIAQWLLDENPDSTEILLDKLFFLCKHGIPKLLYDYSL